MQTRQTEERVSLNGIDSPINDKSMHDDWVYETPRDLKSDEFRLPLKRQFIEAFDNYPSTAVDAKQEEIFENVN